MPSDSLSVTVAACTSFGLAAIAAGLPMAFSTRRCSASDTPKFTYSGSTCETVVSRLASPGETSEPSDFSARLASPPTGAVTEV